MSRFLYENSVDYKGHLIIPFVFRMADNQAIYSYILLSEWRHKGKFHKAQNPDEIYLGSINGIIKVAKEYLDDNSEFGSNREYFKNRYTYQNNLIIIYEMAGKYFYDHYKPDNLTNIAAPKIFQSEQDCINWVKQGLDRSKTGHGAGNGQP